MYKAMIKKSKNKKGFTLVELIVVMAILAILAAILIPSVSGMIKRSNQTVDDASARNLYMAGTMVLAFEGEDYDGDIPTHPEFVNFIGPNGMPLAKTTGTFDVDINDDGEIEVSLGDKTWDPENGTLGWD